jgi:hypothetical protein
MALSGKAAAMGQGVIGDVAQKLVEEFASNLAQMLESKNGEAAGTAAAPAASETPAASAGHAPAAAVAPGSTEPPSSPPPRVSPARGSLPVGKIAAGVIAGRLNNPRTLLIATAAFAAIFGAIGYVIGRSR